MRTLLSFQVEADDTAAMLRAIDHMREQVVEGNLDCSADDTESYRFEYSQVEPYQIATGENMNAWEHAMVKGWMILADRDEADMEMES
jgi:hypothetical protein